jgi:pimeloyl-ACP methyl ester carboxylesterase
MHAIEWSQHHERVEVVMPKRPMPDLIVLLPGITGSVLRRNGKDVWAMTAASAANALLTLGRSITSLELRDEQLDDGVTAPSVMPDLHLIPGLWKIDGYSKVSRYIQTQFDVAVGGNFHHFPYDWRRDNRVAARQLMEQSSRWLHDWRQVNPDAKLILIGHSMGGLISRYFLECLEGWRETRMLITFGTPYRGSLNAFNSLVHGMKKTLGPLNLFDLSQLLRSFTSVYQLLPIYPCLDLGDGNMVRISEANDLPNVDREKAKAADEFHREIEGAVQAHLKDELYLRDRHAIHAIVGTFQPTLLSARLSGGRVEFLRRRDGDTDGDGTVPRVSATPIELSHEEGAMFAADRHASLQNNDAVLVQLAGILSGRDTSGVRAGSRVGLEIDDAFGSDEPVTLTVQSEDPMAELSALITRADTGEEVKSLALGAGGDWRSVDIPPLQAGSYRVTVVGHSEVEPVTDAFVVLEAVEPVQIEGSTLRGLRAERWPRAVARPAQAPAGEAASPGAEPKPGLEQRYLQGRFPESVRLGEVAPLVVRLGLQPTEPRGAALKPFAVPAEGVEVVLTLVDHPGFTPRSPERATLTVLPGKDSDWALFDLEAAAEGVHLVQVAAFVGGSYLGVLEVQASVDAQLATGAAVERSASVAGRETDPGEVSLLIHYEPDRAVYRYQLIDWSGDVPEEATSQPLLQTPSSALSALVAQLNTLARGRSPWDAPTTEDWLKNQGIALWNGFIPEALQREFWARRDQITRMTIISAGDPVPWELLYPFKAPADDAGFLVDQFPVARRLFGDRPRTRLRIGAAKLVLSGGDTLAAAEPEVQTITELLHEKSISAQTISDLPTLLQLFTAGDFDLLHFSCHNTFEAAAPNASRIILEGQPFEPVFLEQHAERFRAPLVFMNACRTDGQAPLYTTLDGWALRFLKAGAGAFVGSLWEVVDTSASAYASEFYRALLAGEALGRAAGMARNTIRNEPGDPTWLAYTLYGDPAATVT